MELDPRHPLNLLVLRHLAQRARARAAALGGEPAPASAPPASHPDPYQGAGSHPDVVERVWDGLGAALGRGARALVHGRPALVDPVHGVVVALAHGTAYVLRVPDEALEESSRLGCRATRTWSDGTHTDLGAELGPGWMFGNWMKEESEWIARFCAALGPRGGSG